VPDRHGFNGYLAVTYDLVTALNLDLSDVQQGFMANGQHVQFLTALVSLDWHQQVRTVQAQIMDEPMIGVRLLQSSRMFCEWVPNGLVTIEEITKAVP